jgi:RsiW-degrading membrane proteinase PrsW (M82 family)
MTGRGYAWAKLNLHPVAIVIPFFLVAAFMHGLYNYLAIQGTLVALMGAILFALGSIAFTGYSVQ